MMSASQLLPNFFPKESTRVFAGYYKSWPMRLARSRLYANYMGHKKLWQKRVNLM
ncbi:MAG: hypothetical protein F6J93_03610 [Oscillatoria sp. SIO1A7]|nr:hypothetical protein [Oscillatoria sp. SIO1A7]